MCERKRTLSEQGAIRDNVPNLGVAFTAQGNNSFSYRFASKESYGGNASGADNLSIVASGVGSYTAQGQGGYRLDSLDNSVFALDSFSLIGGSDTGFALTQVGMLGTTSYNHTDTLNTRLRLYEKGSMVLGGNGGVWNFSNYNCTTTSQESATDWVGSAFAWSNVSTTIRLSGSGPASSGRLEVISVGTLNFNGRGSTLFSDNNIARRRRDAAGSRGAA
jgi:hypothetical protein